jgi:hypothetical protein
MKYDVEKFSKFLKNKKELEDSYYLFFNFMG